MFPPPSAEALQRVRRQVGADSPAQSPAQSPTQSPGGSPAHQVMAQPPEAAMEPEDNSLQRSKSVLRRPISEGEGNNVFKEVLDPL